MIVETKGKKLPVRYGMNALAEFGDLTNKSMNDVMECLGDLGKMKISEVLAFVYAGFIDGARHKKEECQVKSILEVGEMIDDDPELIAKMTSVFVSDSTVEGEDTGDKKK